MAIDFSDDVDPRHRGDDLCPGCPKGTAIEMVLTVAEQRRLVEAGTGEPCVRIWLTADEYELAHRAVGSVPAPGDWTAYQLMDGRWAMWRRQSDIDRLLRSADADQRTLGRTILARVLNDEEK